MHFTALLGTALLASISVSASPLLSIPTFSNLTFNKAVSTRNCGASPSLEQIIKAEEHFAKNRVWTNTNAKLAGAGVASAAIVHAPINIHFHIITDNKTIEYVNDTQIEEQLRVMNEDYLLTGISFKLVNVTRTVNATWFNKAGPVATRAIQTDMKEALRVGGEKDLNIYTVGFREGDVEGLLGYSTFPVDYQNNPTDDGVVVSYASFPGGELVNFNEGRTVTHEVGHWLGLYHVFQGMSCDGEGDDVEDTPPQSTPTSGCPENKDSCTGGGVDSIHNFMDYSYDSCMNNFTPGQTVRMKDQLATYRNITF